MSKSSFFQARNVDIGSCGSPTCGCVHIQFLDEHGVAQAQAVIACESIDSFCSDLQIIKSKIIGGPGSSIERH